METKYFYCLSCKCAQKLNSEDVSKIKKELAVLGRPMTTSVEHVRMFKTLTLVPIKR